MLSCDVGTVRAKDIAKALSVSPASVSEMMSKLADRGLVEYHPYNPPKLTKKGRLIGKRIAERHSEIARFFEALMVDPKTASLDACAIEHDISPVTLSRMKCFVEYLETDGTSWAREFNGFCAQRSKDA